MAYPSNQEIAKLNRTVMKDLSDYRNQDDALIDSCISETEGQLIRINCFGNGHLKIDHAFLYAMALRKLYAVGNEAAKEKVVELMAFRLRTDPSYNKPEVVDYFNAPLILIFAITMGNDDLFEHEPYATLKKRAEDKISSEKKGNPNHGFFAKRNRSFPSNNAELIIPYVNSMETSSCASPTDRDGSEELPIDPSLVPRF